jgi:hypothetical protein
MEHLIYLIVKILSAAYLLSKVFRFLSGKRMREFWRFLTPETPAREKAPVPVPETSHYDMVGKSRTVYLKEVPKEPPGAVEPFFSEDLGATPPYSEEPDITDEDVENDPDKDPLTGEERFLTLDTDPDGEDFPSSTGMTYEQISGALDVIQGKKTDAAGRQAAARILYEAEGSDLFNFLTAQAENEAIVERLIKENIDNDGVPLSESRGKQRRGRKEFDIGKYV